MTRNNIAGTTDEVAAEITAYAGLVDRFQRGLTPDGVFLESPRGESSKVPVQLYVFDCFC